MTNEQINQPRVVAKFGGTSVTHPYSIREAVLRDRPIVTVVSAVGRTATDHAKLTDLLIEHEHEPSPGLLRRMIGKLMVVSTNHVRNNSHDLLLRMQQDIAEYQSNCWPLAALGEKWTAERLAGRSGTQLIMPNGLVHLDNQGELLVEQSRQAIAGRITSNTIAMVPGYYGFDSSGNVATLARGGSDITGALFALALGADEYHNWSDVNGFYDQDPNNSTEAALQSMLSYRDVVSFAGATGCQLLHPAAAELLDGTNTVTIMRNTMRSGYRGTTVMTPQLLRQR